ncbi:alpha/beta fold hydrolase [Microbulbifer elongatus]|uniref:alpha/beta fold hydrolase n=1 Tax=Microbulbifer elongatus TaxID=86173 RepID=UPI001CFD78E4|nr:alpha/beta hydrolase [Microbulbifer elongatus]
MRNAEEYINKTSKFISVDGMHVHYRREGSGPVILLLHGSGSSLHCFDQLADSLVENFEVVRLDLPGFGLTGPRRDRDYRIQTFSTFIARFMSALSIERFSVAGNSLGGNVAWNMALDYPGRVESLILMNATGYPEKSIPSAMRLARNPLLKPLLRRWAPRKATENSVRKLVGSKMANIDDALVDRIHAMMSRKGNRAAFVDLANTQQADRTGDIPGIKVPTLVLSGEGIDGQHFARDIANSREITFGGVGHLLPEEAPVLAAEAIRSHLNNVVRR